MNATFTKLRDGSWGLRIPGKARAGVAVTVAKRDGRTQDAIIGRVLWTGNGITLATIGGERVSARASRGNRAPGGRTCSYCGARDCPRAWDPRALCQED